MGLLNWIKGQLIEVIEWLDDSNDTLVWRFPDQDHEIKHGARLTVREGQVAVFVSEGQVADIFGPGLYSLTTQNMPILTTLASWKYGFDSPFKVDIYFVNTRQYVDLRWGTLNPIMLRDPDFGIVRLRAFGIYAIQVIDAGLFFKELVGTDGHYKTSEIEGALRKMLVSKFSSAAGKSGIAALDMAANYETLGDTIQKTLNPEFESLGLTLRTFVIENISLPEEVEKAMDTRAQMGAIGDMHRYTQFQTAGAIRDAAQNEGGGAGQAMGIGAGLGLGQAMATGVAGGLMGGAGGGTPPAAPTNSVPPPSPSSPPNPFAAVGITFYIHLNGNSMGPYGMDILKQGVSSGQFTQQTPVWREGMQGWVAAGQLTELQSLFNKGGTPPPPFSPPGA